jgi:hypothetical protein
MSDIKSFLHQFCQKNKKEQPQFEVRPTGKIHLICYRKFSSYILKLDLFAEIFRFM